MLLLVAIRAGLAVANVQRVSASGIAGTATVVSVTQTGMLVNGNPRLAIGLSVQLPGRPEYRAVRKEVVPLMLLSSVALGSTLPVKVDSQKQSDVIIQWNQS